MDALYSVDIWSVVFLIILLMPKNIEFVPGYTGIMYMEVLDPVQGREWRWERLWSTSLMGSG